MFHQELNQKMGDSVGITMAFALHSLASSQSVRNQVGITGEPILTGKVLAIGGVWEKTIVARRVKIREIILPKENEKDFEELPDYIKERITVNYVNYFQDALNLAFNIS